MRKNVLVFVVVFWISFGYSQSRENNELVRKADSLDKIEKWEESLLLWEKLRTAKKDKHHPLYCAKYINVKASIAVKNGNIKEASVFLEQAIPYLSKIELSAANKKFISNLYSDLYLSCGFAGDWDKALKYGKTGYDFTKKNLPKDKDLVNFIQDLGYMYKQKRNYEESIIAYEQALKLVYKFYPKEYQRIGLVHNGLATAYSDLHFHNQSLYHYAKGLEYHKKSNDVDKSYVVSSSNNLIWESLNYGDENQAKKILDDLNTHFNKWYSEDGFASKTKAGDKINKQHYKMLKYLSNLRYNTKIKKNNIAKKYLDSIALVFNSMPEKYKAVNYESLLLGRFSYEENFNASSSTDIQFIENHLSFNRKTLDLAKQYQSKHDELVAYLKLAIAYNRHKKYNEALKVIEEAKIQPEHFFNASRFTIEVLEANVLNALNQQKDSKKAVLKAYQKLLQKETKVSSLKQLKYQDFKKFNSYVFIRNVIKSADLYFSIYEKGKSKDDLLAANNLYFIASDMFNEFYLKGKYNFSLNEFNQEIASGLLKTQLLINPKDNKKIKAILNRIENNSSQHLWNVFEIKNSQNLKVPPHLIQEYNQLVFERNATEQSKEAKGKTTELNQELADLDQKIQRKQKAINQYDQSYQQFRSNDFNIDEVQKQLKSDQLMVKYVVTKSKTYALIIDKNTVELAYLVATPSLKTLVNENLKNINLISNDYRKSARKLYEKLLQPVLKNHSPSSLILIPEDFLNAVSFESLQDKNEKWIAENHLVSYAYSIKLWNILQKNAIEDKANSFVSFAPNYLKIPAANQTRGLRRGNLFDLNEAKNEAKAISNLFEGKLFINEKATRDNFLQSTTSYNFHHLAMHSVLEDDYNQSSLVFTNNQKVFFNELYQLNFPSKMVVLSACNTGVGTQESGEGVMSLSRALTYAGVKSAVYSLWQVPDKETSEIMIAFYENLKKGQSKDEALANAKKQFLAKNPMKQHPFYWAGFVVNGDVQPIIKNTSLYIYIGIAVLVLVLLFMFRKKLAQRFQ